MLTGNFLQDQRLIKNTLDDDKLEQYRAELLTEKRIVEKIPNGEERETALKEVNSLLKEVERSVGRIRRDSR